MTTKQQEQAHGALKTLPLAEPGSGGMYSKNNKNSWAWIKTAAVGSKHVLHDGMTSAYIMAARYGRRITIRSLRRGGDFEITIIE